MTRHATAAGVILGTAAYMSPEQARGKRVDRRADIWAYGVVLWEMLTGRKLFEGETVSDVMAAVLTREPDLEALPSETPPSMQLVVRRCLERDPKKRLQWIGDARLELESTSERDHQSVDMSETGSVTGRQSRTPWLIAAAAAVLALGITAWSALRPVAQASVVAGSILPPEDHQIQFFNQYSGSLSVSPDGRWITFSAAEGDESPQLWLRSVGSVEARPIEGTEEGSFPFWSPDSRHIAFFDEDHLKRVSLDGSPAVTLADAPNGRSGGWNRDGVILFSPSPQDPVFRVPAGGGDPEPVTELDLERGETTHRWTTFLPDGRRFLFLAGSHSVGVDSDIHSIWVGELGSSDRRLLVKSRTNALYASGHLLFVREGILLAQPFDPHRAELIGDPIPVASGIGVDQPYYRADFAASDNGLLVYRRGSVQSDVQLHRASIDGPLGDPVGDPARILAIRLNPDGQRAALVISDPESGMDDVWIHDLDRNLRSRLTFGALDEASPIWSPDGNRIAFVGSSQTGVNEISVVDVDGAGEPEVIHSTERDLSLVDWSPDGQWLLADSSPGNDPSGRDIVAFPVEGGEPMPVVATKFPERASGLSPDGRWLLYISDASGVRELFVTSFPKSGRRWQVAGNQVWNGVWRRQDEIFYITPGPQTYTVPVQASANSVRIGQPVARETLTNITNGDIHPDGRRMLVTIRPGGRRRTSRHLHDQLDQNAEKPVNTMIGSTLSHFRITSKLGEGGMGEVYLAEDTKLGRKVALKVLPEEFASDPDRMARFEREARVLASLNHPNIAHLYGLECSMSSQRGRSPPLSSRARPKAPPLSSRARPKAPPLSSRARPKAESRDPFDSLRSLMASPGGDVANPPIPPAQILRLRRRFATPPLRMTMRGSQPRAKVATSDGWLGGRRSTSSSWSLWRVPTSPPASTGPPSIPPRLRASAPSSPTPSPTPTTPESLTETSSRPTSCSPPKAR